MLKKIAALLVVGLAAGALAACGEDDDRKVGAEKQKAVMERAVAAVPAYEQQEFAAREDINWSLQETEGRHIWYVYVMAMDGAPLFYVVSDVRPRNKCVSITPPDRRVTGTNGAVALSSPALDGTYYGGGKCDTYYMRDAKTGGYIQLTSSTSIMVASKVPLSIETDELRFGEDAKPKPEEVPATE